MKRPEMNSRADWHISPLLSKIFVKLAVMNSVICYLIIKEEIVIDSLTESDRKEYRIIRGRHKFGSFKLLL